MRVLRFETCRFGSFLSEGGIVIRFRQGVVLAAFLAAPVAAFGEGAAPPQPNPEGDTRPRYLQTEPPAQPPPVPPERTRGDAPSPTVSPGETPPATPATPETPPRPLMGLLGKTPVGDFLNKSKINIFGHVEGSWTHNFSSGDHFIPGRAFDVENDDPALNQLDLTIERLTAPSPSQWDIGGRVEMIYGEDSRFIHSLRLFDYQSYENGP
jgi:hypothetical protein